MTPKSLLIVIILFLQSCASKQASRNIETGKANPDQLQSDYNWFSKGYKKYKPDVASVNTLKSSLGSYRIIIFGGTWCPDTQRQLPAFYKVIDEAGFPRQNTALYLVDHSKHSPERQEENYQIKSIPVFILMKDGNEKGRIVESPKVSLEKDLAAIVSQ
jgi:thiol-disulfide isomerase/thioredoxin